MRYISARAHMSGRIIVFLAASSLLFSQNPARIEATAVSGRLDAPPANSAKQEPPASVEGRVVNLATGEPLKRANVVLMPAEPRPDHTPYSTATDAAGAFAVTGIPPGKYRLWAERTGYVRTEYGARGASRMGATITLGPGQAMKEVAFRLQPHAVITGRVTDEDGEPVANVQVQALMYRYMQGKRQLMPTGFAGTNDLGEYRIFGLAPGRYYLSAAARNFGMMWNAVNAGPRANDPEEGYSATYYPGTTDPHGAVQIQATAGSPLTNMDIRLRRTRTLRIRGRILNASSNPMMRPMISLNARDSGPFMLQRNMTTTRGTDGSFEIRGVTPGAYHLVAQAFDGSERSFAKVPVDVSNADVEGIEVTVSPGQEISGTVRVEGDTKISPSRVHISLQPRDFAPMAGGGMAMVKEDGSFVVKNIFADTYRVVAMGGQDQFYVKSVYAGHEEAKNGEITITQGVPVQLSVVVSTAGGRISGSAKGEDDAAVQGAMVVLVPETSKREHQQLYKFSTTDQYGKFSLAAIAPGQYKLFAWDNAEAGQWMDPEFIKIYENDGKVITVTENAQITADLEVLKNEFAADAPAGQ
jgi:protocatechuate 3,4-dioxygenase beta subunit